MKAGGGRTIALLCAAAGAAVLGLSFWEFRTRILEEYCLWQLGSKDQERRASAADTLGRISSVRALATFSSDGPRVELTTPLVRYLEGLKESGPESDVIRSLESMLKHPRAEMRVFAAFLLGRLGPRVGSSVPYLLEALKDTSPRARIRAAEALGEIGPPAGKVAIPSLAALLSTEDIALQQTVAEALKKLRD